MSRVKTASIVGCVTAIALLASSALAQGPANRKTYFTFSGPVALPGITLPAGTYTFRLADTLSNRHIVQVLDRDERHIYRTLLAVPAERAEAEGDPVIMFREAPANMPPPVRYWYYAGEKSGNEFVYPRDTAQRIANATRESVMAVDTSSTDVEAMRSAEITKIEPEDIPPASTTATAQPEPQAPPARDTYAGDRDRSRDTAPPTEVPRGTSGRSETLPRTASPLPLTGLIGLLALGGAVSARIIRKALA